MVCCSLKRKKFLKKATFRVPKLSYKKSPFFSLIRYYLENQSLFVLERPWKKFLKKYTNRYALKIHHSFVPVSLKKN